MAISWYFVKHILSFEENVFLVINVFIGIPKPFSDGPPLFVYNLEEAESQFNSCCKQHMVKATKTLITMIQWPK